MLTLFGDADPPAGYLDTRATLSGCGAYRYDLTRRWDHPHSPLAVFVMLNPSAADGRADDPTLRRCVGFAKAAGCGRLAVVKGLRAAGVRLHHLGLTQMGHPRHPLYVPGSVKPEVWE